VTNVDDLTPSGTNDGTATNVTVSDGAFVFNGTDSRISSSITQVAGAYAHTAGLWYYTNDDPATLADYIYQLGSGGTNTSPSIQISSGQLYISFVGNYINITASTYIQPKKWVQILYTYDGGPVTINNPAVYINGTMISMTSGPSGSQAGSALSLGANPQLRVGCKNDNAAVVNGKIANFRLFNRALTQDEIYQLYAYQKEDFGHGDLSMTLKAGRLGIGTSEPRGALDVHGDIYGGCPVYFAAYTTSTSTTTNKTIPWNNLWISRGGGFDTSTGKFTVPLAGVYKFFCALRHPDAVNTSSYARFQLNGSDISVSYGSIYLGQVRDMGSGMVLLKLNVGDVISVKIFNYHIASNYNSFVGEYFSSL
jgi:hypothetical protein